MVAAEAYGSERDGSPPGGDPDGARSQNVSELAAEAPIRILVVDDREENIVALQNILCGSDLELLVGRSGPEALDHLLTEDVAVILLDVLMPGIDGYETAHVIRAREACRHIPIIFLTAVGDDQQVERGYSVGAVDYLVKPLNPGMVKAKVAVFVDLYRKNRQLRRHEEALRLAERARSEEVLRETEALYEASFNSAAVGITHLAVDGRWRRVNPQFCKLTGYSADEASHLKLEDIVHPDDVAEDLAGLQRLAHGEIEIFRRQERYVRKDGRMVWVDLTVSPLRDLSGGVRYFVAVVEDITSRRDAEKRERMLAEVSHILLSSPDHRRDVEEVVKTIAATLGEWCIIGVKHPDDQEGAVPTPAVAGAERGRYALLSRLRGALASSAAYARWMTEPLALTSADPAADLGRLWGLDRKLVTDLGALAALTLPLSARGRAFGHVTFLSKGAFDAGDVTTAYEVTRRLALSLDNGDLYRQTQDAAKAREEFLSIASHELRTPLTPLRIHLQRLLAGSEGTALADPTRVQTVLHRCERKVRRLEALVDTLFDASRVDRHQLQLQLDTVDLGELTRRVADSFAEETTSAGCQVTLDVRGAATGRWDRLKLEQVISNVIENAIKYGPGKPIEIEVEGTADHVRLSIRDHGVGIPGTQLEAIFERVQRIISSPHHSGLRLGLSITRQIVEAHNGHINADSEPGAGARFTIELPRLAERTQPTGAVDRRPGSKEPGKNARRAC